jgi:hypothetical protein
MATASAAAQFKCKICGGDRDYQTKDRLISHIRRTERYPFVNSKNLDEWNIPRREVEAKLKKGSESSSEEEGRERVVIIPENGTRFDSDQTTLDRYLEYISEEREPLIANLDFHARRLGKCVAILTTGGYLVKQLSLSDGKVVYNQMSKKGLVSLLETLTIKLFNKKGEGKVVSLAGLLNRPRICLGLTKFRSVDFYSDDPNTFNLWRGFAYRPARRVDMRLIQPYLDHLKEVICSGNEELYQHELKKRGWMYQNPNDHLGFATVLFGEEGTGKNTDTDVLCSLWGADWAEPNITNMEMLTEANHAECITYKKLIVANEVQSLENSKASWDVMKSRVSDDFYRIRLIYCASKVVRNVNNYYFCTNNADAIKMGLRDRRYQIIMVSSIHAQDTDYFSALRETITDDMKSHLLRFFLNIDTAGFNPRIPPSSEIKKEMQEAQKPLGQLFMEQFDWVDSLGEDARETGVTFDEIYKDGFLPWCDRYGVPERYRIKMAGFGLAIRDYVIQKKERRNGKDQRIYYPKKTKEDTEEDEDEEPEEIKINGKIYKKGVPVSMEAFTDRVRKSAPAPSPESPSSPESPPAESPLQ